MILPDVRYLYIYRPANEYTTKIFEDGRLWSSKPERFNDPFDCDLEVSKGFTEENVMDSLHAEHGQDRAKWPPELAKRVESGLNPDGTFTVNQRAWLDQMTQKIIKDNKNSGVVCLSEVNDSILMWSHYAQNHTGICIEFRRTADSKLGDEGICAPVLYSSKYPVIDFGKMLLNRDGQTLKVMMWSKADCWAYEKEWRMTTDRGDEPCKLVGNISRVIFGLRTSTEYRNSIQNLCKEKGIPTVQARKVPMEFRIEIPD